MNRPTPSSLRLAAVALIAAALLGALCGCDRPGSPGSYDPDDGGAASITATVPLAGKVEPPPAGAYLGVYVPPAPFTLSAIDEFRTRVGKDSAIVMWYQPWALDNRARFDSAACLSVMRRGKVPLITWEPWDPGSNANTVENPSEQSTYRLSQITGGAFDSYIRQWAKDIRALGGPVMLRPMHEMNGVWYPWSGTVNGNDSEQFVAAWRHIHDIFESEGATNVTWVWSINHESVPNTPENAYAKYYPGDEYVDWTAISGFNFGTSKPNSRWQPFWYWYSRPMEYLKTLNKPICVAEFASVEMGGSKGAWIADAYKRIRATPEIKAVIYYDALETGGPSTQDWRAATSETSLAAFRKAIAPVYFVPGPAEALAVWGESLEPKHWAYLATLTPIY